MLRTELKHIIEGLLMTTDVPLSLERLCAVFEEEPDAPNQTTVAEMLSQLTEEYKARGLELVSVASGYRIQVPAHYAKWHQRLYATKPARYSPALLETLALIAYRQPITRGEIEEIRGVSVSSQIMKTLQEREWVEVVGHKEVPGRPSLWSTTVQFLDDFNIQSLEELPSPAPITDLNTVTEQLDLEVTTHDAITQQPF